MIAMLHGILLQNIIPILNGYRFNSISYHCKITYNVQNRMITFNIAVDIVIAVDSVVVVMITVAMYPVERYCNLYLVSIILLYVAQYP